MEDERLRKELDELWARAAVPLVGEAAASLPPAPSLAQEAHEEVRALLKSRHQAELFRLRQMLELKDQNLAQLSERLSVSEAELVELRRDKGRVEGTAYQKMLEIAAELDAAQKALKLQEERFEVEGRVLRAVAEQTRQRLAAETARWRALESEQDERERELLLKIETLNLSLKKADEESAKKGSETSRLSGDLEQAKSAIEKTLSELFEERRAREGAEAEREKALAKVREVEEHFQELQNLWQEERKQWQEIWERERSTWDAQRQEFSRWEEKVRKEREEWHAGWKAVEEKEARYAEQLAEALRQSSEAGTRVAALLRAASGTPRVFFSRLWLKFRWGLLAALAAAALAVPLWRQQKALVLTPLLTAAAPAADPSALASDGAQLWLARWEGELLALSAKDGSLLFKVKGPVGPYHPVAMAFGGNSLYTLDSSRGRILRHPAGKPSQVVSEIAAPGLAPALLVHDGARLWSYDAVSRTLHRHLDGGEAQAIALEPPFVPAALAYSGGRFWAYDARAKLLRVLTPEGETLKQVKACALDLPVAGLAVLGDGVRESELWVLLSGSGALRKLRAKG